MVLQDMQRSFIFPRIPLLFTIPDGYPELGAVSNITVIPEIEEFNLTREEAEIKGNYEVVVSYFTKMAEQELPADGAEAMNCQFFSSLKIESDGFLAECENGFSDAASNTRELYTVHFSRPFHTYIDMEFISRPRSFRPAIVVEKVELEPAGERFLKGELVLGFANRSRRNSW